jgi:protein O-GlcNAc transferase
VTRPRGELFRAVTAILLTVSLLLALPGPAEADLAATRYHKAMALKKLGKIDEAIKELRLALADRPNYVAVLHSLGMLLRQKGEFDESIRLLEQAVKLEPKNGQILYSLGIAYHKGKRVDDAIRIMTTAATLSPKDDLIQYQLGAMLVKKEPKKAIPYLEAAVKAKPEEPDYVAHLGLAYRRVDNLKLAEQYLVKAAGLRDNPLVEFDLGVLYRKLKKVELAIEHYEKAIQLDPKMAPAHWDLGHMYTLAKRPDDAVKAFQAYVKLKGDSADVEVAKQRIKELKGKK